MPRISAARVRLPLGLGQRTLQVFALELLHGRPERARDRRAARRRLSPARDLAGQVLDVDVAAARQHHGVLDGVFELAHVARERELRQRRPGRR